MPENEPELLDNTRLLGQNEKLRAENAKLWKHIKEHAHADEQTQLVLNALKELIPAREEVPPATLQNLGRTALKTAGIIDIGDVHFGELVTSRSTGDVARYSPEIARRRFDYTIDEAIRIGKEQGVGSVWMIGGGDMISGDIHDDLSRSNETMPIEQTLDCSEMMYGGLEKLCQAFPTVEFLGVSGNHARMYRKPFFNRKQIESLDYILYKILEYKGADQPNLKFHTPESFYAVADIADRKFLVMHGDTIKQQNSFSLPFYGMWKEFMKWKAMDGVSDFDDMIVHHNHIPVSLSIGEGTFYGNGALKGKDDFSLAGTRLPAPATQRFLTVEDGKVVSDHLISSEHIK